MAAGSSAHLALPLGRLVGRLLERWESWLLHLFSWGFQAPPISLPNPPGLLQLAQGPPPAGNFPQSLLLAPLPEHLGTHRHTPGSGGFWSQRALGKPHLRPLRAGATSGTSLVFSQAQTTEQRAAPSVRVGELNSASQR